MRNQIHTLLALSLLVPTLLLAQENAGIDSLVWRHLSPGAHPVGYKVIHLYDTTRCMLLQADLPQTNSPIGYSRPIQISVWYPASKAEGSRRIERIDYFLSTMTQYDYSAWADASRAERIAEMRRRSGPMLSDDQFQALAHEPMSAWLNAPPATAQFPLIVYGTGGGSEPWENSVLFEYLAGHGYVVATCPSFGTYSFEMEDDSRGLETKVRDMEFILSKMLEEPYVDAEKVGAAGWSWGGLGGILMAMRDVRIDAVISLDGSIAYFGGRSAAQDNHFFDWRRLRVPLLHVSQRGGMPDVTFLDNAPYFERTLVRTLHMNHEDFAWSFCIRTAIQQKSMSRSKIIAEDYAAIATAARTFLDRHMHGIDKRVSLPGGIAETRSFAALPAPPLPEEFLIILRKEGPEEAEAVFNSARQADPNAILFEEEDLLDSAQRLTAQNKTADALRLLNMVIETYPESWLARANAAALLEKNGDADAATRQRHRCQEIIAVMEQKRIERSKMTTTPFEELAGPYGEGMQGVVVAVRGENLVSVGEPELKLVPVSATEFNIEQRPGISIRFVINADNRCEGILLSLPNGEMALAKKQ